MTYPLERDWGQRKCDTVRITLFFPFFLLQKSWEHFGQKGKRIENPLGGGQRLQD